MLTLRHLQALGFNRLSLGVQDLDPRVQKAINRVQPRVLTESLIDEAALGSMKREAWLINVARGPVIDEEALIAALQANKIGGAGLDVFVTEPLPPDNPLWRHPKVICTPRQSGGTVDYHELALPTIEQNLKLFAQGRLSEMLNIVPH